MKVFIKILFASIISVSSCFSLLAQEELSSDSIIVSEEIATGHVFVDGVYIEPPYIVRKEGWKIFINGILVFDYQKPRSPFNFSEKPKANFDKLEQNSGLSDIFEIKDTTYNMPLAIVIGFYYLEKYEYSVACDSIVEFYRTIPNVKSFTKLGGAGDTFEMVSFNNESRVISLQPYGRKHNQDFGPNQNPDKVKEIDRGVTSIFNDYCRDLSLGNLLIYFKSEGGNGGFQRVRIKSLKIKDFCNILISEDSQNQKVELLTNIVIDRAFAEKVVLTFLNKSILIRILEQTSSVLEKSGENKSIKEINQDNSPNKAVLMAWCPNLYEAEFQYFLTDEIALVRDEIEGQGYVFDANNIFVDNTYHDHNFGTCTYENLKKMASAGFLYIASHGFDGVESDSEGNVPPAGITVLYSDSESAINEWTEGDPNILIYQLFNYWFGECWTAIATSQWAEEYLAPELYENNAISILSVCHSYTSGWVDACSGGICFGYDDNTNYWFDVDFNNRELLRRMNGTCGSPITNEPIYREAHDAYESMLAHYDDFMYRSNNSVRLCPAPESFSPANMEYIRSNRNSGSITFDSWCAVDNYHRAEDALHFTCTEGIVITDVHWVLQGGNTDKSDKIEYSWEYNNAESGEITVIVNPEYIVAYGGGNQQLDFDGVAPNGEQGTYKFFIEPDFKCGIVAQPSTLVDLSAQGEHLVSFEALCNDEVLHYQWFFEGGTPSASSLANPIIAYNNEGVFDVTLTTTGPDNQTCFTAKANYISVYDASHSDNDFVSCDYSIIGDKQVQYYLYVDYVPEGAAYDITLYFGDGYNSNTYSVGQATTIGPIFRTFGNYGVYNSYLTISYEDETEILYLSSCGEVFVFDPNPCGNFIADFEFSPEDPQPNQTVTFEPIIGNCSGNCYWSWEFANQASAPIYTNSVIWCNQTNNTVLTKTYPTEGNYYVKLTAYETANGCPPTTIEKEVPVRIRQTCYDPINIYSSHYKPGNPIDRVLIRKKDLEHSCAMELYWHHTINTFSQCQPFKDPSSASMYLYKFGTSLQDIPNYLIKHSPYSSQIPWIFPSDFCYYTPYTALPELSYGRYIFKVDVSGFAGNNDQIVSADIDVDLVDCDYTASYIVGAGQNEDKFSGAVNNPPYYSSGKFVLNSAVNDLVNVNPTIFTACNGIILCDGFKTGTSSFVATGDGFADCIQEPICWWGYNYAFPNFEGDTIQSNILSFDVSPNPFRNYLTVHFEASDNANIILSVFNSNGSFVNMLKKTEIPAGYSEFEFDLSYLPPATYMLKAIINDNEEKTLKITKQ